MSLRVIIFDVDGTLAETEEAHRTAFNRAFAEAGLAWVWTVDDYRRLLAVTGGQRRIRHFLASLGAGEPDGLVETLHRRKNALYAGLVASGAVALRPGVARLIGEARQAGIKLAIATTTSRTNLDALIRHVFPARAAAWFDVIVVGEDVAAKKPDPEAYVLALAALRLPAASCVAIEDSLNGLRAAQACGIVTVVTPSIYTDREDFDGAALVRASLDGPGAPVDLACLERLTAKSAQPHFSSEIAS